MQHILDEAILREYLAIDYIVRGEGEKTFLEIADKISNNESILFVDGISYFDREKCEIVRNPSRKSISDLDNVPFAARDIAKVAFSKGMSIEIGMIAQRGCPFSCSFCNANKFFSNDDSLLSVRYRSPLNVVEEIESLIPFFLNQNAILRFYDATFITRSPENRKWINEFCNIMENRNIRIPFDVFIRSDSFDFKEDNELIIRLKNIGLINTYVGLEAGDDDTLEIYNKEIESNQSVQTIHNLRKFGIEGATNGVITFHQNVTLEKIRTSILFLHKIGYCSSWNVASRAETLPGIALEKEMLVLPRETVWDVENYEFNDSTVANFYDLITMLKGKYQLLQFEDYLIRQLRENMKLRLFYRKDDENLQNTKLNLERDIEQMQTITRNYFIETIDDILANSNFMLSKYQTSMEKYVNSMMFSVYQLGQKYNHLRNIEIGQLS